MIEPTERDGALLGGEEGPAAALAMRIVVEMAEVSGARSLIDVTSAHIDSCLYHGQAGLDFAERLAAGGGRVGVPTTLNVSSLDLLHPELYRGDPGTKASARRLMEAYVEMGCRATWTCAPYQLPERPAFGQHIAWAESNAIVFANSVLGARTDRYGDFIDICAAITGRAPLAGLHLDEHRLGTVLFRFQLSEALLDDDALYPVVGHLVGRATRGTEVPVLDGLPPGLTEDRLKAIGAAAASSGAVAMFHATGSTPEAPTTDDALGGRSPQRTIDVSITDLNAARAELSSAVAGPLSAVSVGTPHLSLAEFETIAAVLGDRSIHPGIDLFASTGRDVLAQASERGLTARLEAAGITLVTDTCTYITPILGPREGVVMTDSGKWAWYAPGNLGVDVLYASLRACIESAVAGEVIPDEPWT